jgi:hypothetical protein
MKRLQWRIAIAAGAMSAAALGAASAMAPAAPKNTEWCAIYRNGSENCTFTSQMQCTDSVSGLGGFCRMSYYVTGRRG